MSETVDIKNNNTAAGNVGSLSMIPSSNAGNRAFMNWSIQSQQDLTDEEFSQWRLLLEDRTGIHLVPQQKAFLQSQLNMRTRELGGIPIGEYYQQLHDGIAGAVEWSMLIDRLVIKETSFFRHSSSFDFVRNYVQERINSGAVVESFDVWSVGCSTGEEPYSLAMVIDECFENAALDKYWGVTGSDVSTPALNFARQGVYAKRKVELMISPETRQRYFRHFDDNRVRVIDRLRERVCFAHGNVNELKKMPIVKMDLISTHNMLIYFRRWRRRKILNNLAERLKLGGVLLIGLGEIVDWEHPLLEQIDDVTVQAYRRVR